MLPTLPHPPTPPLSSPARWANAILLSPLEGGDASRTLLPRIPPALPLLRVPHGSGRLSRSQRVTAHGGNGVAHGGNGVPPGLLLASGLAAYRRAKRRGL